MQRHVVERFFDINERRAREEMRYRAGSTAQDDCRSDEEGKGDSVTRGAGQKRFVFEMENMLAMQK